MAEEKKDEKKDEKNAIVEATYEQDSKRYHRFTINEGQGFVGNVYVPKDKPVPDSVTVILRTKAS